MTYGLMLGSSVAALATAGLGRFLLPIALKGLAEDDIFYTLPPEMKGLVVVRGKEFHHAILSSQTLYLNDPRKSWYNPAIPKWEVLPIPAGQDPAMYVHRSTLAESFGGQWVGVPWFYSLYSYTVDWVEMGTEPDGSHTTITRKNETTKFWFAKDVTYVIRLKNFNTAEGLPVSIEYTLTVRVTNPNKALFVADDWLLQVQAAANPLVREFTAKHTWEELRQANKDGADLKNNFNALISQISDLLPSEDVAIEYVTGTKGRYGVEIVSANFQDPQLIGPAAEKYETSATAVFTADNEAKAKVVGAKATAEATRETGFAEAEVTERKGAAAGKALEALLTAADKNPDLAKAKVMADALATPGDGKVIVDLGSLIGTATSLLSQKGK